MTTITSSEQERRDIIKQYPLTYPLALIGIGLLTGILLGFRLFASPESGYAVNLYTTVIDIGVTVGVIEVLSRRRDEGRAKHNQLQMLLAQMRSRDNGLALAAVEILRLKGWLEDGSLSNEHLISANLREAILHHANLHGTRLVRADLQEARLASANLQEAYLLGANLRLALLSDLSLHKAHVSAADLQKAGLERADLQEANLEGANLCGARLLDANMLGAILQNTEFDERTTLPDGSKWSPNVDVSRFTDPQHPQFWRSDFPFSPAYRGDSP